MSRRLNAVACALSLLLCAATVVLWVRSYFRVDTVNVASTRLHRIVSGGGGIFFESLVLQRESGSLWRPSLSAWQQTISYELWESAHPQMSLPGRATAAYGGRVRLARASWGGDFNRAVPAIDAVSFMRWQMFDNGSGATEVFRLLGTRLWIPYWLIFVLTALPAVALLARHLARPSGGILCRKCGYDLRATPNRCPECGTPIAAKQESASISSGQHRTIART